MVMANGVAALDEKSRSLFLGLVEDLGLGWSSLVVGREGLLVEALDGLLRVGQLLRSLGPRYDDGLGRENRHLVTMVKT